MRRRAPWIVLFLLPIGVIALDDYAAFLRPYLPWATSRPGGAASPRPACAWAQPLAAPHLENFFRVGPGLYRGAQPDAEGMRALKAMGIRTVVNLRYMHSDRHLLAGTGLAYREIDVNPFKPTAEQLVEFLRVVQDPNCTPVFVHCHRGIDRTGMMCAVYRMVVCGWPKDEAIAEMQHGPFGYDAIFRNVPEFLWTLDVQALGRRVAARP